MEKLNGLDLFSGIGGIGLALEQWVRTVAYCEREPYAQGVLLSRMQSSEISVAPIWDDVTTLRGDMLPRIDIIFGGFPCQDLSVAGRGKGLAGERSGLFFEIVRLAKECNPRFIFLENVPAIRTRGGEAVVKELASIGYDCRWTTLSAASVGAPHKRDRWFLLASADSKRKRLMQGTGETLRSQEQETVGQNFGDLCEKSSSVAHAMCPRLEGQRQESSGVREELNHFSDNSWWTVEPAVGRVANGIPNRVHRIKCLGNGVVPLQVREAFKKLAGID